MGFENSQIKRILALKEEKNALILAHYYEDGPIQDIADHVGDSYFLAKKGQESKADIILLAGVVFMAESVKLLNPTKKVLVPDLEASCSLVKGSPYQDYLNWRLEHKRALAITYINSSVEVKSLSDAICTSSNAEKIIQSIPQNRPILFGPDANLGRYLMQKTGREMILWPGSCEVHVLFHAKKLEALISQHPDAVVISHPECDEAILKQSHVVGSTSRLLEEVKNNPAKKFIIGTEAGIFHQMKKVRPDAQLLGVPHVGGPSCSCNECPYMKLNTLDKVERALMSEAPEITIGASMEERARLPLERMMAITAGQVPDWPLSDFSV